MDLKDFRNTVFSYYLANRRSLPWRETTDPYAILVSEIMLQQTQAERVMPKYEQFIQVLPNWRTLADCDTAQLLSLWQGLGYNRRALSLRTAAQKVVHSFAGNLPADYESILSLPGVGPYTAGAVLAFAFQQGRSIIETNIRRVFIHHFFKDKEGVTDRELMPLIEQTLDSENPREWYYALMDYGSYLAKQIPNPNRKSAHYSKQSKFEGSDRQIRGEVVRRLLEGPKKLKDFEGDPARLAKIVGKLLQEGFITRNGDVLSVS